MVVVADQLLLKRQLNVPVLTQVQVFYRDFRSRLLTLGHPDDVDDHIGQTIEAEMDATTEDSSLRYLYVDAAGVLHFADRLDEVPPAYRQEAQRLTQ